MVRRGGSIGLVLLTASSCSSSDAAPPLPKDGGADAAPTTSVNLPAGCDVTADAKTPSGAACADDNFAVFADSTKGDDAAPGSKTQPVHSIGQAVAKATSTGKRRVYVCGPGPYAESVKLTSAVSIYGGQSCGTWTYDGSKATVVPTHPGYALEAENVGEPIVLSDLDFVAADAEPTSKGQSSVALFANKAVLSLVRVAMEAGNPTAGADGEAGVAGSFLPSNTNPDGNDANGPASGVIKICACFDGAKTIGGGGGGANGPGAAGMPLLEARQPGMVLVASEAIAALAALDSTANLRRTACLYHPPRASADSMRWDGIPQLAQTLRAWAVQAKAGVGAAGKMTRTLARVVAAADVVGVPEREGLVVVRASPCFRMPLRFTSQNRRWRAALARRVAREA